MGELMSFTRHFARDQDGSVLVEATVLIPILLVFLLGAVDFSLAFYNGALATKAVEVGARIAAVSDPVAMVSIVSQRALPYRRETLCLL